MTTAPRHPVVIVLNGVGSVGKSSVARAVQQHARRDFLHVAMDTFVEMLPARSFGTASGLTFAACETGVAIHAGTLVDRTLAGMRRSVVALADAGNDVIVDEVMLAPSAADDYRALLGAAVRFVGLHAPLDLLEERERARGDREPGLARWQFDKVHAGQRYDLEIDTSTIDPDGAARRICAELDL